MISLIVWNCNFTQSIFLLIYGAVFKRSKWNLFWPPIFSFFIFLVQKIIWWSDNPMFISPHYDIFSFVFVSMWLIRVDALGVTLVGDFIICLRTKVLQNSTYFFASDDILFASFIMFLFILLILNHSDIILYSNPLLYVILRLTYWTSLNCLTVFDLEVYTYSQHNWFCF